MGLVLDTSALIAVERSGGSWPDALAKVETERVLLPAIVYAELLAGVQLADTPSRAARRRAKVNALVAAVGIVEFGPAVAEQWAALFAELSRAGALIPSNDLIVAATARQFEYRVLVGPHDEVHFRRVPGLGVERVGGP